MSAWLKPAVHMLGLLPLLLMVGAAINNQLGPDPGESLMHSTGEWAARLLILTLCISPLRQYTGSADLLRLRRPLGLYTFFYACIHLFFFLHFYLGWLPSDLWEELLERPFITVGFSAWLVMLPLAITSNSAMQRRLRRNWQRLHRGVYVVAVLVSLHYLWQARSDIGEALLYSLLFAGLLLWRFARSRKRHSAATNSP
jgi:sulfoxide reductase heme-binding subunit YedZ